MDIEAVLTVVGGLIDEVKKSHSEINRKDEALKAIISIGETEGDWRIQDAYKMYDIAWEALKEEIMNELDLKMYDEYFDVHDYFDEIKEREEQEERIIEAEYEQNNS